VAEKKNSKQNLRDARELIREHDAKKSDRMISFCAEKVADRMNELITRQFEVNVEKEVQKRILSDVRKTMSVEFGKMICRGVTDHACAKRLYDCHSGSYECGINHTFNAEDAVCRGGAWDDFECKLYFSCSKLFECKVSFDKEDCEGTFVCSDDDFDCVTGKDFNNWA
jgi:hypothetical protein